MCSDFPAPFDPRGLLAASGPAMQVNVASGPTMGARFDAQYLASAQVNPAAVADALQAAVDQVDARMSTWKPASDLNRLNGAAVGAWVALPPDLLDVLAAALAIGRASGGAFDIAVGNAVRAWGFGPGRVPPDAASIRAILARPGRTALECLEIDQRAGRARRLHDVSFDLSGIAKGYGVDALARCLDAAGICNYLVGIDGEVRCRGRQECGARWTIAVEHPAKGADVPLALLDLDDCAVATSGNARNRIIVNGREVSHLIDPRRQMPAPTGAVVQATVVAPDCMAADAWATALMVLGPEAGLALARQAGLEAMMVTAEGAGLGALSCARAASPQR